MRNLLLASMTLVVLSLAACKPNHTGGKDYPMFWTWLDYREGMNFDSVCTVMDQAGIDGVMPV
jgi:hypothetical protein